jgi:ketopantoate reductase
MRRLLCENFAGWLIHDNGVTETIMLDPAATTVDLEGKRLYLSYDQEAPEEYVFERSFHLFPNNTSITSTESDAHLGYRALYLSTRKTLFVTEALSLLVDYAHNSVTIVFTEPGIGESGTFVRTTFYRCSGELSR